MYRKSRQRGAALALLIATLALPDPATAQDGEDEARQAADIERRYQEALEMAEDERLRAEQAIRQAQSEVEQVAGEIASAQAEASGARQQADRVRQQEMAQMREELGRAHRDLRRAQREIARVHRDIARETAREARWAYRYSDDRVVLGLVFDGRRGDRGGARILAVSPDGPADRAGLRSDDVVVGIEGLDLADLGEDEDVTIAIQDVMADVEDGQEVRLDVLREGTVRPLTVVAARREPLVWESIIELAPGAPLPPEAALPPDVVVERLDIPEIDTEALERQMAELAREVERFRFVAEPPAAPAAPAPPGTVIRFSNLGEDAIREANLWFGYPFMDGLRLAAVNPALGQYFGTERGLLVLEAPADNELDLVPGDVILSLNGTELTEPGDLFRTLRRHVPGDLLTLELQREGDLVLVEATMPEPADIGFGYRFIISDDAEAPAADD